MKVKELKLKEINDEQKKVVKHINNMIIEHQQIFQTQPEELLISKKDYNILSLNEEIDYITLGKIKIYSI